MLLLDRLRHWLGRDHTRPDPEALLREEALRNLLRERCRRFRSLLAANRDALEAMSEMERYLTGVQPYGMGVVHDVSIRVTDAVFSMVGDLNALSDNAYASLYAVFEGIRDEMAALQRARPRPGGPLVLPLSSIGLADAPQVGVKMANLGEAAAHVGLAVPDGFAVSVSGYDCFMEYCGLRENLERHIRATDMDSLDALFNLSAVLQREVLSAPLPPELEHAIAASVETMRERAGGALSLAIRSSAVGEDSPGVSFAGQYRSELHVPPEEACHVYKEIVASKYAVTAMSYRYQHGIPDDEAPMCVGIMSMVPSAAGGVAYSRNPVAATGGRRQVLLNAVRGLARGVVEGVVTPDVFLFSHTAPPCLLGRTPGSDTPSITDEQAAYLARVALALEEYYNEPQDVEWALNANTGEMVLLQCRPLCGIDADSEGTDARPECVADELAVSGAGIAEGLPVLISGGVAVSPGVGMGPIFVARKEADILSFPRGGILVVNRALPRWAPLLSRASGIVSETGGMAGHLASVAREYRLPALFGLAGACDRLEGAGEATLDAGRCTVFAGIQPRLAENAASPPNLMAGSVMHKRLAALARLVVPLHLLDPESPGFHPRQCRTLHDITRFCHEKAVEFLFEADPLSRSMGKQLKAGARLQYWIIDIGGGFSHEVPGTVVDIGEIASTPMLALWNGMVAVPWSGPPAASASSFMAVMLQSTMNPDLESTSPNAMSEKNFFIVSNDYMLFQGRYGYHLCTVESFAGSSSHESFVNFQFKGGAADRQRRRLRAVMVARLLEAHGFRAAVKDDGLFAVAEDFPPEEILLKTRLLGYLLIHTRQADMIMLETERAAALQRKLAADMEVLDRQPLPVLSRTFPPQ